MKMGEEPAKETEMAQPVGAEGNPRRMVCSRSQVARKRYTENIKAQI